MDPINFNIRGAFDQRRLPSILGLGPERLYLNLSNTFQRRRHRRRNNRHQYYSAASHSIHKWQNKNSVTSNISQQIPPMKNRWPFPGTQNKYYNGAPKCTSPLKTAEAPVASFSQTPLPQSSINATATNQRHYENAPPKTPFFGESSETEKSGGIAITPFIIDTGGAILHKSNPLTFDDNQLVENWELNVKENNIGKEDDDDVLFVGIYPQAQVQPDDEICVVYDSKNAQMKG